MGSSRLLKKRSTKSPDTDSWKKLNSTSPLAVRRRKFWFGNVQDYVICGAAALAYRQRHVNSWKRIGLHWVNVQDPSVGNPVAITFVRQLCQLRKQDPTIRFPVPAGNDFFSREVKEVLLHEEIETGRNTLDLDRCYDCEKPFRLTQMVPLITDADFAFSS